MLDPEIPSEGEGETDGVADAVHQTKADRWARETASRAASIPLPWTTTIAAT